MPTNELNMECECGNCVEYSTRTGGARAVEEIKKMLLKFGWVEKDQKWMCPMCAMAARTGTNGN